VKVLSVVGNRPQFIKSAPLSLALREAGIDEIVLHTGQHYDPELSQVFFDELGLAEPAYRLELHSADPEAMRPGILDALERERPDWTLVYGDTNTTLAGARAAVEDAVPVAHVEAGLRSGDLSMPEERNRIEVDRIAQLLFAPDERSRTTLEGEGAMGRIDVVGDVMRDALDLFAPIARERSRVLERVGVEPGGYLVCTVHREANVRPERLHRIVEGLNRLDAPVVFPAHPRTASVLSGLAPHVQVVPPIGYLDFGALASQSRVIVTDSGGLQKEAYWYGVPCVTMRPSTEWVDTVAAGANVLVDDDPAAIERAVREARMPAERPQLYGDGHAARHIAAALYPSRA
jgi:UDP-N-acetylglucosamine 2-epimerase